MKRIVWLGVLMLFTLGGMSQKLSKEEKKKWEYADIDFEIGDYKRALETYKELHQSRQENSELNLKIGVCLFQLRKYDESKEYLENSKNQGEIEAYYYLGQVYHLEERLDEEIEMYQYYKNHSKEVSQPIDNVNYLLDQAKYAQEMMEKPVKVDIINVGSPINTEFHEYVPLVFGSEDEMYFTARRPGSTGEFLDHRGDYFEDVYVCRKVNGFWADAEELGPQINTDLHDACVGISSDGQKLFVFRTSEDLLTGDIYQSDMGIDDWGPLEKLGSDINTEFIESSASLSSDDRVLYFSSNREGGYGGMDIYRAVRLPNGEWSKAQNLGPTINTLYNDDSPFIHTDNKTLYFISQGHKTMGGYDVFVSELGEDGLWSEPKNMGYPINTLGQDMNFMMSADKQTGYYSSSARGGYGGQDIYKVRFKLEAQIQSIVKGGVASGDEDHIPIEASITLIDVETKEVQGIYKSNPTTGQFVMVVVPESTYQVIVEADGYHTFSDELYFGIDVGFGSLIEEFKLKPLEVVAND